MNIWDILILCAVAVCTGLAFRAVRRAGNRGCTGCCLGCTRSCTRREGL